MIGKTFGANDRTHRPILAEDDKWITLHPGGKGPKADGSGSKKGVPCLIDDQGKIKGGLGGHFNGVHVKDVSKISKELRAARSPSAGQGTTRIATTPPAGQRDYDDGSHTMIPGNQILIRADLPEEIAKPAQIFDDKIVYQGCIINKSDVTLSPEGRIIAISREVARKNPTMSYVIDPKRTAEKQCKAAGNDIPPEVNSPLTSMVRLTDPLRINRSSPKAVRVAAPDGRLIWIPKSCVEEEGGFVKSVRKSMFYEKFPASIGESTTAEYLAAKRAIASYVHPPMGFLGLPNPMPIVRETDKAVGVKSRSDASEGPIDWFPKSQVITHSGHVIFLTASILRAKRLSDNPIDRMLRGRPI